MSLTLPQALRAIGGGVLAGTVGGTVLALLFVHLGIYGFYAACFLASLVALAMSYVLERRDRRAPKGKSDAVK
jgi:hypothetical protein